MLNKILQWSFMSMSYFYFIFELLRIYLIIKKYFFIYFIFYSRNCDHQKPKNNKIKYRYKKQKQIVVINNKLKNDFLN
jgi:hypothetical protein